LPTRYDGARNQLSLDVFWIRQARVRPATFHRDGRLVVELPVELTAVLDELDGRSQPS